MDFLAHARRRAFSLWLRTGRLPRWARGGLNEVKYNPWHDPENGRFTFAGTGRYFGRGGSGSGLVRMHERVSEPKDLGFNGGGAAGSFETHADIVRRRRRELLAGVRIGEDWRDIRGDGHTWTVDGTGAARVVLGTIKVGITQKRSKTKQRQAGGADRLDTDDGGHYTASRFNAPTELFNLFAQNLSLNRGKYRDLENEWARDARAGKNVDYLIIPRLGNSSRPTHINVWWWVDGEEKSIRFTNRAPERTRGKR